MDKDRYDGTASPSDDKLQDTAARMAPVPPVPPSEATDEDRTRVLNAARAVTMKSIGEDVSVPSAARTSRAPRKSRGKLALAGVGAALCLALIGVSSWALVSGAAPAEQAAQEPAQQASAKQGKAAKDGASAKKKDKGKGEKSAQGSGSVGQVSEQPQDGATVEGSSGDQVDAGWTGGDSGAGTGYETYGGDAGGGSDAPSSNGGGSGSGGATDSPSGDSSTTTEEPQANTVTVTVSADGSVGGGGSSGPVSLTFEEGATVYDALCATGWNVNSSGGAFGVYVTAINGVAAGGTTGWTYSVNGAMPNMACDSYTLSDGDQISWVFVEVQ